ncbi:MAG: SGNH/GDSL hydrolase family protein [Planctomycetota bacterium]|jgi:lysophospholipase L1-like esterase
MRKGASKPRNRKVLAKIGLATGSVLFLLAGLELGSYLFGSFARPTAPIQGTGIGRYEQYDYELFWTLRPHALSPVGTRWINSDGLREPELGEKQADEYRILHIGESSTFGFGVQYQQTYSFLLEERLDATKPELEIRSLNAGVPGYTTLQGVQFLLRRSEKFAPDMVTLYFGFNDFLPVSYLNGRGGTAPQAVERGMTDWELFNSRDSATKRFAATLAEHSNFYRGMLQWMRPNHASEVRSDQKRVRVPKADRLPLLTLAHDYCQEKGIELVIIIPIYKSFELHAKPLRENASALGLPIVDLPAILPASFDRPREEYFRDPVHPGPEGHRLIAEATAEVVAELIR